MKKEYISPLFKTRVQIKEKIADVTASGGGEIVGDENDNWDEW